jgi:hypothetical protein
MLCLSCGTFQNDGSGSDVCKPCQAAEGALPQYELAGHYGTL